MMELQLGLSLLPPTSSPSSSSSSNEGLDLNHFANGSSNDNVVSRRFLSNENGSNNNNNKKKRMFSQAFSENIDSDHQVRPKTLPLLWYNNHHPSFENKEEEDEGVVGWPPVKTWRRRACCHVASGNRTVENGCSCGGRVSKFMYVKVKVEGVAIARKIDLSAHSCFDTLINTLMDMFGKCHEDSENFKLTYQDREGDWLLAQDVPWRTFIRSVQRLKLVRRNH